MPQELKASAALFRHFSQFFPNLHHRPSVEFAVFLKGFAGSFGFIRRHILDFWEDGHCIAAVLHAASEVVIIETRLVGEQGRKHALDTERAAHGGNIVVASTKRVDEVNDMVADVQQMHGKVGIKLSQLIDATALKHLVVG